MKAEVNSKRMVRTDWLIFFLLLTGWASVFGQGVGISSSSISPDPSSILELRSTTQGVLVPRMTTTERDAIGNPANGLLIYNSTTGLFNYYDGNWKVISSGVHVNADWNAITGDAQILNKPNYSVQSLSGITPSWDVKNGLNAILAITGNTIITLSNLATGTSGNLTLINSETTYSLTFSGYSNRISQAILTVTNQVATSGGNKIDIFSWYFDGNRLFWNGTLDYK